MKMKFETIPKIFPHGFLAEGMKVCIESVLHYNKKIMSTKSSILSLSNNVYFSSALELSQLSFTIIIYLHTNYLTLTHSALMRIFLFTAAYF